MLVGLKNNNNNNNTYNNVYGAIIMTKVIGHDFGPLRLGYSLIPITVILVITRGRADHFSIRQTALFIARKMNIFHPVTAVFGLQTLPRHGQDEPACHMYDMCVSEVIYFKSYVRAYRRIDTQTCLSQCSIPCPLN